MWKTYVGVSAADIGITAIALSAGRPEGNPILNWMNPTEIIVVSAALVPVFILSAYIVGKYVWDSDSILLTASAYRFAFGVMSWIVPFIGLHFISPEMVLF